MSSTELARIEPGSFLALNQEPAEIAEIIRENLGGQEIGEFDLPRVKIPAGGGTTWEIPTLGGTDAAKTLSGVIVHFKLTRAYWPETAQMGGPPQCRSNDQKTGVGTPGGDCGTCPLAEFGSGKNDNGQACSAKEIWFLLREVGLLPMVLALPATSLKAAKQYRVGQLGSAGVRLATVKTDITLVPDTNASGERFSRAVPVLGGMLDPDEAKAALEYSAAMRPLFDSAAEAINAERDSAQPTGA